MKIGSLRPILLFVALTCGSLSVEATTLREAVEYAVRTNSEILASANRRFAADQGVLQARAGYLPRVDLSAGAGRERLDDVNTRLLGTAGNTVPKRDTTLTLSQMLFDGFAVKSEVARQTARVDSSAYGVIATAEDVALRAAAIYLEVLRRQETVSIAQSNLEAHQRIFKQIKTLTEGGVGRRADFDQAKSRLAFAEANLIQEQGSLRDAQVSYIRVIGTSADTLVFSPPLEAILPKDEITAIEAAVNSHPSVKSAEADVVVATALNANAKAALFPRLDLEVAATHGNGIGQGATTERSLMLRLRYNLSRGGSDTGRINETNFQIQEARELLERVRGLIQENVSLAYNANVTAHNRLDLLRTYASASEATRDAYIKQFSIGQRTLLDLLNAENEYFTSRVAYVTGQYSQATSVYRVFSGMGQLLAHLKITLPTNAGRVQTTTK